MVRKLGIHLPGFYREISFRLVRVKTGSSLPPPTHKRGSLHRYGEQMGFVTSYSLATFVISA